jgi:hypothetical protein
MDGRDTSPEVRRGSKHSTVTSEFRRLSSNTETRASHSECGSNTRMLDLRLFHRNTVMRYRDCSGVSSRIALARHDAGAEENRWGRL